MTTPAEFASRLSRSDIYLSPAQSYDLQKSRGFIARRDNEPWPLKLPLDWSADPFDDPNWCSKLQHWRMTDPILEEYFKTGDRALLAEAFSYAADWHRFHIVEGRTAPRSWSDAVTGIRLARLAFFLDRLQAGELDLDARDEALLRALIDIHIDKLTEAGFISTNNHGLFQVLGLKLASYVLDDASRASMTSQLADQKFQEIFAAQYDEHGVHREHSPSYHYFAEKVISPIAHHFSSEHVKRTFVKVEEVKKWLLFPNGLTVRVGDSDGRRSDNSPPDGPAELLRDGRGFLVGDLTRSGYAIVRSPENGGPSMLFATAMANSMTHKHADDLSFELYEQGRPVIVDSGKYGYFTDENRKYVKSAAAHNTISLENDPVRPSSRFPVTSVLHPIVNDGTHFRFSGRVERAGLFVHERTFLYNPGRYLVLLDEVSALPAALDDKKPETFASSLHFAPDLAVERDGASLIARLPDGGRLLFVDELTGAKLDLARGRRKPMLGWHSPAYGEIEPTTTVRALRQATRVNFTWTIAMAEDYRAEAMAVAETARERGLTRGTPRRLEPFRALRRLVRRR